MDETTGVYYKLLPSLLIIMLLSGASFVFIQKYTDWGGIQFLPLIFDNDENTNQLLYKLNFFVNMGIFLQSLLVCIFFENFFSRMFSVIFSFTACIIGTYVLEDVFSINLCLYVAYIIAISISFSLIRGLIISSFSAGIFIYSLYRPKFIGLFPADIYYNQPDSIIIVPVVGILLFAMISTTIARLLFDKYSNSRKTIEYLITTEKQLALFNSRLQRLARKRGREAVKHDRLKFTRDVHDTCGYAFTNIILLSDAAVSKNEMDTDDIQELFHKVRNLASKGLQETRSILYFIRENQMPYTHTVDDIFQIKSIFEKITGIKVEVVWGNMNQSYDSKINKIIIRIIQEAFTNSIRHGQASFIQIQFWESFNELVMTITDNGKGSRTIVKGIGLAGMEERLHLVNGKLAFSAPPTGGFRLTVIIPIIKGNDYERSKT
jgi:signal transduction histidine kinase